MRPGQAIVVDVAGRRLAIFRSVDECFALDDACPHQGASLATGSVHGGRVICPLHSWVFDLRTGRCPADSHEPVAAYPTRCVGRVVEVRVPDPGDQTGSRA